MIKKFKEPQIQPLDSIVDVYFDVEIDKDDTRIQTHDLKLDALSVWVTFLNYKKDKYLIEIADEGLGVGSFVFTDEEKVKVMSHIEEKMNEIEWE